MLFPLINQNHSNLCLMITSVVLTSVALIICGSLASHFISNYIPINYLSCAIGGASFLGAITIANMITSVIFNKKTVKRDIQLAPEQEKDIFEALPKEAQNEVQTILASIYPHDPELELYNSGEMHERTLDSKE